MKHRKQAAHRAHMPEGTERIVGRRRLGFSHRRLAELLRPGMAVLDIGCGTGAMTRDMAEKVMPGGRVLGVDVGPRLIDQARAVYGDVDGLQFTLGDVYELAYDGRFDVVNAARVLQWLHDPGSALQQMVRAAAPGGKVVVLDYNHAKLLWEPEPPETVRTFYEAFLAWRTDARMNNAIADDLEAMFHHAGLRDVLVTTQHEEVWRGDAYFEQSVGTWETVAATRGHQMVSDGVISEGERAAAERDCAVWARDDAVFHRMYLLAVEGTK